MELAKDGRHAHIMEIMARLKAGETFGREENARVLDELAAYECWLPYRRILNNTLSDEKNRTLDDYIRLAKTLYAALENEKELAEVAVRIVRDLDINYKTFATTVIPQVLTEGEFDVEAKVLQAIQPVLSDENERILCLERLCLLFEKKIFDEVQLNRSYEHLLALDPKNLKALRYFKMVYSQTNDWDNVARILRTMLENSPHKLDRARLGLEAASVYLYQLDNPSLALATVEKNCIDGSLDTSTVRYDAYARMQDWQGCIDVLKEALSKAETPFLRALVLFKLSEMTERMKDKKASLQFCQMARKEAPKFIEPLEKLIDHHIDQKNWSQVLNGLRELQEAVREGELVDRVKEAVQRLQNGMDYGRN